MSDVVVVVGVCGRSRGGSVDDPLLMVTVRWLADPDTRSVSSSPGGSDGTNYSHRETEHGKILYNINTREQT